MRVLMRGLLMVLVSGVCIVSLGADGADKRLPIPTKAAQVKALELVHDVFKEDIEATKDPQAKAKLAVNLLQQGKESREDAATRYEKALSDGGAPLAEPARV